MSEQQEAARFVRACLYAATVHACLVLAALAARTGGVWLMPAAGDAWREATTFVLIVLTVPLTYAAEFPGLFLTLLPVNSLLYGLVFWSPIHVYRTRLCARRNGDGP